MAEGTSVETIRAAVACILPGVDGAPGAADLGVERHVIGLLDLSLPGLADLVAALLDAYAADVRSGAAFRDLDDEGRSAVLRAMSTDPSQDVRDAADALLVFTLGGMSSEWSGFDRETRTLRPPAAWSAMGYHGPVHGHPDYLEPDLRGEPRPEPVVRGPDDV